MFVIHSLILLAISLFGIECVEASWKKLAQCGAYCFGIDSVYLDQCSSISQIQCFHDGNCNDEIINCHCFNNIERLSSCLLLSFTNNCTSDDRKTASLELTKLCSQRIAKRSGSSVNTGIVAVPTIIEASVSVSTAPAITLAKETPSTNKTERKNAQTAGIARKETAEVEASKVDPPRGLSREEKIAVAVGVPLLLISVIVTVLEVCCFKGGQKRKPDPKIISKIHQWRRHGDQQQIYSVPNSSISTEV